MEKKKRKWKWVLLILAGVVLLLIIAWKILVAQVLNQMEAALRVPPPGGEMVAAMEAALVEVADWELPEGVEIVALGEATHGNGESFALRQAVFRRLVEAYGCRAFALEEGFGSAWRVNRFIGEGQGTAREAAEELGIGWMYHNQDMADLLQWMHDFNQTQAEENQIRFYGFDMQNIQTEQLAAIAYLETVDAEAAKEFRTQSVHANSKEALCRQLQQRLEQHREVYIALSGEDAYLVALQNVACMRQGILKSDAQSSFAYRDAVMAENVSWILEFEKHRGRSIVFVTGHNGHTVRTSYYRKNEQDPFVMGSHLAARYGAGYYSIGMEIYKNTFTASRGNRTFTLQNDGSQLTLAFAATERDMALLPVEKALQNPPLEALLTVEQRISYGDAGAPAGAKNGQARLMGGTLLVLPAKDFDAILFLREGKPPRRFA